MAPKGGNAKKEAGRSRKAENEAKKKQAVEEEKVVSRLIIPSVLHLCAS